jgi:hypothetical protein
LLLQSQRKQTFRYKGAHISNEHPDAKINAYHVFCSNCTEVIFGIQALYRNSCLPPDVPHMLHVLPSFYIYRTLPLSLCLSVSVSHFNCLNFNCKCRVPQRNPPFISQHNTSQITYMNQRFSSAYDNVIFMKFSVTKEN